MLVVSKDLITQLVDELIEAQIHLSNIQSIIPRTIGTILT